MYPSGLKPEAGTLTEGNMTTLHGDAPPVMATFKDKEVVQRCGTAPHSCAWWEDTRQLASAQTRQVQTEHKEDHLHHEDSQAVDQIAQRGCAGSSRGVFQDPAGATWADPRADPALSRLDWESLEVPSNLN